MVVDSVEKEVSVMSFASDDDDTEKAKMETEEEQTPEEPKVVELTEEEKQWRKYTKQRRDFQEMIQAGLDEPVVFQLIKMFESGWIRYDEVDDKLKTGLCSLTPKQGVQFLKVMWQRDMSYVSNKCSYLLGQMKVFNYYIKRKETIFNGPDPKKIEELQQMTGYTIESTTGQRRYGGPPPGWEGPPPTHREISISKVPNDWYEDKLVPLLSQYGKIYELRIMIDNITGWTRNFCFVKYCDEDDNENALKKIDGYNFEEKKTLKANFSSSNKRVYVGNIPKDKTGEEIDATLSQYVPEITGVEVFVSDELSMRGQKNRGFCFVEFTDHRAAALGKKILAGLGSRIFNGDKLRVEWFEPQSPSSEQEMTKTKTIHVGNISSEVKEDLLTKTFEHYGKVLVVQKVRDYAFIHMEERDSATKAIEALNGAELAGLIIKCGLSESGALKRKVKRKADARRLRGERKLRKAPPQPKRSFGFGRGGRGRGRGGGGGGYGYYSGGYGRGGYGGGWNYGFGYGGFGGYYGYGGGGGGGGGGYGGKRKRDDGYGGGGYGGGGYGGGGYGGGGYNKYQKRY